MNSRYLNELCSLPVIKLMQHSLQADVSKQKTALQKHSVLVKTQQKELQTATLELGRLLLFLK